MAVFRSLETAHFGADFYAVFRDDFTDLHQNLHKRSSLVLEWRRRFEFLALHLHSKKIQPDRCRTWLFFGHWKPLILEQIFMPCSVTTSPTGAPNGSLKSPCHRQCGCCSYVAFSLVGKKRFSVNMVRARVIAWRTRVKVLQRDELFDSVTAAWCEGGS